MKKKIMIMSFVILTFALLSGIAIAADCGGAVECHCGDTLTSSQTMWYNLSCSGDGITIGLSNLVLDCDGHTIRGDSTGYGIRNDGNDDVTIQNCIVKNFLVGIRVYSALYNTLNNNSATNNSSGIHIRDWCGSYTCNTPNYHTLSGNTADYNIRGIRVDYSADNVLIGNTANSNSDTGFDLDGADRCHAEGNVAYNNRNYGFFMAWPTNDIFLTDNSACNSGYDIYRQGQASGSGQENTCDTTYAWNDIGVTGCTYACPSCTDTDGDGVCDEVDVCPGGDDNLDADMDSIPDYCDSCPVDPENDGDDDGLCESDDNCPFIANFDQQDLDLDGLGDVCDEDIDGDDVANQDDNCPYDINGDQSDFDGDGAGDVCDADDDGDGIQDSLDACVPTPVGEVVNEEGCSIAEICPCAHPIEGDRWKNHGAYVSCVARTSEAFLNNGLITETEKNNIVSASAQSSCGSKN